MILANTPYDDVFRTLLNDCSRLIIPVINEMFHTSYTGREKISFSPNEHFLNQQDGSEEKRITDSCLMLDGDFYKRYHFECECLPDNTVSVRIFEYDSQIALDNSRIEGNKLIVTFPKSAVLFLRSNANTPDEMIIRIEAMNGEALEYAIPVMKTQKYTIEEIFEKKLLFLIPFYIFSHESRFEEYNSSEEAMEPLLKEYQDIEKRLEELRNAGEIDERTRHTIIDMSNKVLENIAQKYDNVKKGVHDIMGGQVLEYETKTIFNEGIEEGLSRKAKATAIKLFKKNTPVYEIADIIDEDITLVQDWIDEYAGLG